MKVTLMPAFTSLCSNHETCGFCPLYNLDGDWRDCQIAFQGYSLEKQIELINEMAESCWEKEREE